MLKSFQNTATTFEIELIFGKFIDIYVDSFMNLNFLIDFFL